MNCFCTVSQWMLKEYVLHRSILFGGRGDGREGRGGAFCSYLWSVNLALKLRPWLKWREMNHCFFCLKKRLYAVKLAHLLHSSPCSGMEKLHSLIKVQFLYLRHFFFYWHYTWNNFEIKLNNCLEWELLSLCCGVWPLIVIYRVGKQIVGGQGGVLELC